MIRACLFLLAGVYALQLSSFATDSDLIAFAFVAFIAALVIRHSCAWFFVGLALFAADAADVLGSRLNPNYAGDSMVTRVVLIDFPAQKGLTVTVIARPVDDYRIPPRIRISWYEPPVSLRLGDVWQFELRLKRPRGNRNPGVFDYEAWLFRSGIHATGYVVPGRRNHLIATDKLGLVQRVRQHIVDRLVALLPERDHAAVLAAVSVGARHLVTSEQWEQYARTGTSHLMAISGLHIGLAAGGAYVLAWLIGGLFARRGNQHRRATVFALIVAALYALISGLAVPAQRASLMIALASVAVLRSRQLRPLPVVAAACLLLAAVSPVETMAPGFKLSFAAVLVLIWIARRSRIARQGNVAVAAISAVRTLAKLQVMLLFGLLPLTALIFGRVSIAAPLVNLIAVPVFSVVTVPFTLLGLLLDGPLKYPGDQLLFVAAASLSVIEWLIEVVAAFPGAGIRIPAIEDVAWAYLLLPLALVMLPAGWPGRLVSVLGVAALLLYRPAQPDPACVEIDALDVGQGLAVVVRTRNQALLYDTGPAFRGGGSVAHSVVLPFLQNRGIVRIDKLVVSHADLDHAGGVAAIASGIEVGEIILGEAMPGLEPRPRACRAGDLWQADGVEFRVLHPRRPYSRDGNDASCVLMVSSGVHRLLLTGDIEKPVEDELHRRGQLVPVTAVVVPHHGSRTSSSAPFVRALRPQWAIVSASHANRWGFPKPEVVERWHGVGAQLLDTAASGTISLRLCADKGISQVSRYRLQQRRIWHE